MSMKPSAQTKRAREIAVEIGLAERTVTTHLANIHSKLGVGTRVAAVMKAANMGLINLDGLGPRIAEAETG